MQARGPLQLLSPRRENDVYQCLARAKVYSRESGDRAPTILKHIKAVSKGTPLRREIL